MSLNYGKQIRELRAIIAEFEANVAVQSTDHAQLDTEFKQVKNELAEIT